MASLATFDIQSSPREEDVYKIHTWSLEILQRPGDNPQQPKFLSSTRTSIPHFQPLFCFCTEAVSIYPVYLPKQVARYYRESCCY
jgi:hypothetical protein